jgi:hypothetical protein
MGTVSLGTQGAYVGTYFLGSFGMRICTETLVDMSCISSLSDLNLVISTLSWCFLNLLKNSYHPPISPPVLSRTRIITAVLQIMHFMIFSTSVIVNPYSIHRFALLLSIPYCLFFCAVIQRRPYQLRTLLGLSVFCFGSFFISTDSATLSVHGMTVGLAYACVNAHLPLFIESAAFQSGADSLLFQESVSGFKVIFSVLLSASLIAAEPTDHFAIQLGVFPICLIVAVAALQLTVSVSMISLIGSSSALTYLVVEQFCELMVVLIGHTLNPTRFTTFREEVMSFIGFALALPGMGLFFINGEAQQKRPTDVEPFQINPSEAECEDPGIGEGN